MGFWQYLIDHFVAAAVFLIGFGLMIPVFLEWFTGRGFDWISVILMLVGVVFIAYGQWIMRKWHLRAHL